VPARLSDPSIHENLHPAKQVAAVIVVPGGRNNRDVWLGGAHRTTAYRGSADENKDANQTIASQQRNKKRGIQRKYHTFW